MKKYHPSQITIPIARKILNGIYKNLSNSQNPLKELDEFKSKAFADSNLLKLKKDVFIYYARFFFIVEIKYRIRQSNKLFKNIKKRGNKNV